MFLFDKNARNFDKLNAAPLRLAAVDVGSNAIRLVIADYDKGSLRTVDKTRVAIRLGGDVFQGGSITGKTLKICARAFKKFRALCEEHKVQVFRAVGTSALRESANQKSFVELMKRKSGLTVEIIDGIQEASLIFQAINREIDLSKAQALLIDIGGGSVELTIVDQGKQIASQSFPFGTVRMLEYLKTKNLKEENVQIALAGFVPPLTQFFSEHARGMNMQFAVGTGGNFEALRSLRGDLIQKSTLPEITRKELLIILERVQSLSLKDRTEKLGLRPDRADVVVLAGSLIQLILTQSRIERLLTPSVGLKDGVLWSLVSDLRKS